MPPATTSASPRTNLLLLVHTTSWTMMSLLLMLDLAAFKTFASRLSPLFWNTTNPIFRIDNTDHVQDVEIDDSVDLVCPLYPQGTPHWMMEWHSVFQVTREEYETCHVTYEDLTVSRHVFSCDRPHAPHRYRLVFREFTPLPNGLEFSRGNDYYFVATSNGSKSGMMNTAGGACEGHKMKVIFKVCCQEPTTTAARTTTTAATAPPTTSSDAAASGPKSTSRDLAEGRRPRPGSPTQRLGKKKHPDRAAGDEGRASSENEVGPANQHLRLSDTSPSSGAAASVRGRLLLLPYLLALLMRPAAGSPDAARRWRS